MTTVWAFKKIKELDDQTGFVQVEDDVAGKLISTNKVQDPRVGGAALKHIDYTPRKQAAKKAPVKAKDESVTKG